MQKKEPIIIVPKKTRERDYDHLYKIALMGEPGVGKSSLIIRQAEGTYSDNFIATISPDIKITTLQYGEKIIKLQLFDTVGQTPFRTVESQAIRGTHAIMFVFDLTLRDTFKSVKELIKKHISSNVKVILVGNKSDLISRRVVDLKEIEAFMKETNGVVEAYIETSAKTGSNVDSAFETATKLIHAHFSPQSPINFVTNRKMIADQLNAYIKRIEGYKDEKSGKINFAANFSFFLKPFSKSRAINREGNYGLAKELLKQLNETNKSIREIFADVEGIRDEIMKGFSGRQGSINRGINSKELNNTIRYALSLS